MAGNTAVAQPCRSETLTGSLLKRVEVFKEIFTSDEVGRTISPRNKVHGRCIGRITGLFGRSQLSAGIPFFCREYIVGFSEDFFGRCQLSQSLVFIAVGTGRQQRECHC